MSKRKTRIVWLRFEVADTPKAQAEFQHAADRLFDTRSVESRGQFSEEEVVGMVKEALFSAQAAEAAGGACTAEAGSACRAADGEGKPSTEQSAASRADEEGKPSTEQSAASRADERIAEQIMTGELSRLIKEALHDEVARICRGIADAEDVLP